VAAYPSIWTSAQSFEARLNSEYFVCSQPLTRKYSVSLVSASHAVSRCSSIAEGIAAAATARSGQWQAVFVAAKLQLACER
jgi:hypothetical protein